MSSFPELLQFDTMDCGPTCLRMIAAYYGRPFSSKEMTRLCSNGKQGMSLLGIYETACEIGFRAYCVKITWEQLKEQVVLPCIVHWNRNHFVVVYRQKEIFGKQFVFIADPSYGHVRYSLEDFLNSWIETNNEENPFQKKGIALLLEPTQSFFNRKCENKGDDKFTLKQLSKYLHHYKKHIFIIMLAMAIASMLSLLFPFVTQGVVDRGVIPGEIGFVKAMLIAQLFIVFGQLVNDLIRSRLMLFVSARVSISLISDFLAKMMRLPISFFDTRRTGDILQRIQDHTRIQDFLTSSLLGIVMAGILFVVYGVILGGYDLTILCVFLIGSILYTGWVIVFLKWRRRLDYRRFQEAANNQSSLVQLISGMQEIKLNNCERQKRTEWEDIQERLFGIAVKGLSLSQIQQVGGVFIDQIKNVLISFLAAKSVIDGNMTLGMMTALTFIIGQLNAPMSQLVSFIRESQDAGISMDRLGEIHNREDEEPSKEKKRTDIPDKAGIEFEDVTFQYEGPHSPKVLNNISLTVPYGKVTALVGASGSGKTTMLKLMLGFYPPITGRVTLGGVDLKEYSESAWRRQCGCVMQDGFIFSNSIAENIALCDVIPDMDRVKRASDVANIRQWIESLPLGYNTRIGADGHGLSVGQKQRILIARAAYKNSPYLFFDEATNSLDANNEMAIMENLNHLFKDKTVVIIAHRLSTVKNADNIIVLDNGRIVEEGTHLELTAQRGAYFDLVRNQLELGQ